MLDLAQNLGPAGGYAAGLRRLANEENRWLWVMDDDCEPGPTLLEQLLESADRDTTEVQALPFPAACDAETGSCRRARMVVRADLADAVVRCGVPREDLFFWAEDGEYFFRLRTAGHALVHEEDALVRVVRVRNDSTRPAWKYYYITRNGVYGPPRGLSDALGSFGDDQAAVRPAGESCPHGGADDRPRIPPGT